MTDSDSVDEAFADVAVAVHASGKTTICAWKSSND